MCRDESDMRRSTVNARGGQRLPLSMEGERWNEHFLVAPIPQPYILCVAVASLAMPWPTRAVALLCTSDPLGKVPLWSKAHLGQSNKEHCSALRDAGRTKVPQPDHGHGLANAQVRN